MTNQQTNVAINRGIFIAQPLDDVHGMDVSKDAILAAEVTTAVPPGAELAYVFMRRPFEPRRTLVVVDVQRLAAR